MDNVASNKGFLEAEITSVFPLTSQEYNFAACIYLNAMNKCNVRIRELVLQKKNMFAN